MSKDKECIDSVLLKVSVYRAEKLMNSDRNVKGTLSHRKPCVKSAAIVALSSVFRIFGREALFAFLVGHLVKKSVLLLCQSDVLADVLYLKIFIEFRGGLSRPFV